MKLSVILCVYNTLESYLNECLQSIFDSTLKTTEFEVILIDDGSELDYSQLIEDYPVKYYKIENRGPFGARIYGVKQAVGEFVAFLDSDDSVSKNYHLPMLDAATESGADIVINGWAFRTDRTCRTCYEDTTMATNICSEGAEALLLFSRQRGREHSYFVNWNKIYKRDVILKTIEQLERDGVAERRLAFAEDALFNFFNFKNAQKVININSGFYFYRIHESQNSREKSVHQLKEHVDAMSFVLNHMLANIGSHPNRAEIEENIIAWCKLMARSHYQVARSLGHTELFPHIKSSYCVERLEKPLAQDGSVYAKAELLGENFAEIDCMLVQLYISKLPINVHYETNCRWVARIVENTVKQNKKEYGTNTVEFRIPKRRIRMRDRIIHNYFVYRVGMVFFKKGSRIRAFLKKYL